MLWGEVRPGRSPIKIATHGGTERRRDRVADRDAAVAHHGDRRDPPARELRPRRGEERGGVRLHGARRQATSHHERDVADRRRHAELRTAAAFRPRGWRPVVGKRIRKRWRSPAALATVSTEPSDGGEVGDEARLVERFMHRVAGARVGEAQVEQRRGRERCAGARKPDPGRRVGTQRGPQVGIREGRDGGVVGFMAWALARHRVPGYSHTRLQRAHSLSRLRGRVGRGAACACVADLPFPARFARVPPRKRGRGEEAPHVARFSRSVRPV